MLYIRNWYNFLCQWYLNKTHRKNNYKKETQNRNKKIWSHLWFFNVTRQVSQIGLAEDTFSRKIYSKWIGGRVKTERHQEATKRVPGRETRFSASASRLWAPDQGPCPRKQGWPLVTRRRPLITQGMGAMFKIKRNISAKTSCFNLLNQKNPTICGLIQDKSTELDHGLYAWSQRAQGSRQVFWGWQDQTPPGCTPPSCLAVLFPHLSHWSNT